MIYIYLLATCFLLNHQESVLALEHPCYRKCVGDEKICTYELNITLETTMNLYCGKCPFIEKDCFNKGCISAGGNVRPIIVANNMIPGPPIMVCENDTIKVTVRNKLKTDTTTIHWHGIHQVGTFFMDGLPMISQYPILPSDSFDYEFKASPHGTHIWHGHSGFQESDGLFGALIVRRKEPDEITSLYDYDLSEHTVAVWHWYDKSTADVLVSILQRNESVVGFGFLINGKAAQKDFQEGSKIYHTPREIFYVNQGYRYRFRLLFNSAIYCPIQVSVDNHKLKIISSETSYFEPVDVESLMVGPGDRFDFVLNANKTSSCYPMRFKGIGDCGPPKTAGVHEVAFVCYDNSSVKSFSSTYKDADRNGTLLNPFEIATYNYSYKNLIQFMDLKSTEPVTYDYSRPADLVYYVEIQSKINNNARFPGAWHQFNNVTFNYPSISFIKDKYKTNEVCTDETRENYCKNDYCKCTYTKPIPKNALIETVLVDLNTAGVQDHPVHLHGYKFYIVAMDAVGTNISLNDIKYKNEKGLLNKNLQNAISKDTVSVPNRGFAILRFHTSNTGIWLLHCHVTNHMELGMAMLLQVGTSDEIMKMCENRKQCGHWNSGTLLTSYWIFTTLTLLLIIFMYF